ncbi:hypothetical protein SCHPADRAFT_382267 [Schizopora paradoxa]|uniref:Uncharacterized protein n=1 Tax=Schizopora paradoxa TaxID=27342 RepID=A0A0H2RUF4_9AGAM|nr:hypothetical protein SCHPADRAFT_382267 [Schizopora paradoxa]
MLQTLTDLIFVLSCIPILVHSSGALVNISIDDTFSNPSDARLFYGLTNQLAQDGNGWSIGANCSGCLAQPDPSQTFDHSWHDTSTSGSGKDGDIPYASLSFTGVAVYVMGIIISKSPSTNNPLNNTRMFFQIDGVDQGNFTHFASVGSEVVYSYNTTFFSKENLSNGQHNITIMCGDGNQSIASNCLLDRVIYTGAEVANNTTSVINGSTSISSATMYVL